MQLNIITNFGFCCIVWHDLRNGKKLQGLKLGHTTFYRKRYCDNHFVSAIVTEKLLNYRRTRHGNAIDRGLCILESITIYICGQVTMGCFFFSPRRWPKLILIDIIHCGHLKDTSNAGQALGLSLKQTPLNDQKFLASQGAVRHAS